MFFLMAPELCGTHKYIFIEVPIKYYDISKLIILDNFPAVVLQVENYKKKNKCNEKDTKYHFSKHHTYRLYHQSFDQITTSKTEFSNILNWKIRFS